MRINSRKLNFVVWIQIGSIHLSAALDLNCLGTECIIGEYEKCLIYNGDEDAQCRNECLDACVQWEYKVKQTDSKEVEYDITQKTIHLNVASFSYQIFREENRYGCNERIVSVIGGAIGFWTSLDVLVIARIVLTAIFSSSAKLFLSANKVSNSTVDDANVDNERPSSREDKYSNVAVAGRIFSEQQTISGSTHVFLSKWFIRKTIWICLFLGGVAVFILMFFPLFKQFREGYKESNVKLIFNKSLILPPIAICIDFHIAKDRDFTEIPVEGE